MRKFVSGVLLVTFLFSGFNALSGNTPKGFKKINRLAKELKETYHITIEVLAPSPTTWQGSYVTFDALEEKDYEELEKYCELFKEEFSKYPTSFIQHTKLRKIIFVKNLINQNVSVAALPDYYQEYLYYDIYVGNYNKTYQRHVVHHEFYHMIEEQFNGNVYYKDSSWKAFNTEGFTYGNGGINTRSPDAGILNHPADGFIDKYAMSGLEEDKAEIFACMLTTEETSILKEFADLDLILRKKIDYMTEFLARYDLIDF